MHGDFHMRLVSALGLPLVEDQHAILADHVDVLPSEPYDVTAALAGVEQQREREARLAADRMLRLEALDLRLGPVRIPWSWSSPA